jgi:hypothetical protein
VEPNKKLSRHNGRYSLVEQHIKNIVIDNEFMLANKNNQEQYTDYELILDMLDLVRGEKNYDWQSNIFIGLMTSHFLTDAALWAMQDFATRDFYNVYLEKSDEESQKKALAAKTIINVFLMTQRYSIFIRGCVYEP